MEEEACTGASKAVLEEVDECKVEELGQAEAEGSDCDVLDHLGLEEEGFAHDVLQIRVLHLHMGLDSLLVFQVVDSERVG